MVYSKNYQEGYAQSEITLKTSELYKYPRSILIPIILFLIGMVVVFIIYKLNSVKIDEPVNIKPPVQMPLTTQATFNVETSVLIGKSEDTENSNTVNYSGDSTLNIDLSNGKTVLENLELKSDITKLPEYNIEVTSSSAILNTSFPSTGKVNLDTGEMDISLDLIITFTYKTNNGKSNHKDLNIKLPLSGNIDRDAGIIKLSGEATIPPGKENLPIPVVINVVATSKQTADQKMVII